MKILLSMPYLAFDDSKYLSSQDSAFPIGMGYVAGSLEEAGHEVSIFDFQLKGNTLLRFQDFIKRNAFEVIGFSVTSVTRTNAIRLAQICKGALPSSTVIIGGAYPTIYPKDIISQCLAIDFEVTGEGEFTVIELLEAIQQNRNLKEIRGIVFRDEFRGIIQTEPRPLVEDLDSISFPAHHLFDLDAYQPVPGMFFKLPLRHIISTRGCPFKCVFCDDRIIWRGRCRLRSAENIIEEMEVLKNKYNAKEIHFYDDTFTVSKQRVYRLCGLLRSKRLGLLWRCASRVDTVDRELLKEMYSAGCHSISYGIESGDDEILKKMNKGTTVAQAQDAVRWAKEAKIQAKGFFMMNFPGETVETTEKTIALAKELDLDFSSFNLTIPHHGEELKKLVEENYELNKEVWFDSESRMGNEIYFFQPSLPAGYLKQAYSKAVRGFYFRPKYIIRMALSVRNLAMLKSYILGFLRLFKIKVTR